MKRILLIALGLLLLVLGARALFRALSSDETKLRWRLEAMEEGYNEGDVGDAIGPIARDWKHDGAGEVTRDYVSRGLAYRSFQGYDQATDERIWRLEIDWDSLLILVEGDEATTEFVATFLERGRDGWNVEWKLEADCRWRRSSEGWFLYASSHENLEGSRGAMR